MKRILVTGASGFIGKHCINVLVKSDYEIHALTRNLNEQNAENLFWYTVDLFETAKVEELFQKIKPTHFLHLAWKVESGLSFGSNENEKWYHLSKKLVHYFYDNGGERLVVSGSCFEYDLSSGEAILENENSLKSNNEYGKNKNKLYQYLKSLQKEKEISFAWGRIFFTFGPGQKSASLVPYVISSLKNDTLVETTDGNQEYDYLYVEDVALALVSLVESTYVGAVNISSGKTMKLKELILKFAKVFEKEHLIKFGVRERPENSPSHVLGNIEILTSKTNWKKQFDIDKAVEKTINFYK
ncbi:MAG TPA: hypothetical protein DEO36_04135 [Flavobacteriaceae bacterium]|nr:hypothetical protein [Flavobacteriaceae bacterium]